MSPSKSRRFRRPRKQKSNTKKILLLVALIAIVATVVGWYSFMGNSNFDNVSDEFQDNNSTINGNTEAINSKKVLLETSMGYITIQLRDDMPITSGNFISLVTQGVYDNTIFHRIISDFMIQGGDPTGTGFGDPDIPSIIDEFSDNPENNKNEYGTIAMANAGPNTGSSQFFINVKYNGHLDNIHPVFGEVIEGMEVVENISEVETANDKPVEDVVLIKASIIE